MNLQSGTYYWPTTLTNAPTYPTLDQSIDCDVLIVGGGSSAAQSAYYLSDSKLKVVVIEKQTIGSGSTSANTSLLQYSGEKMFTNLVNTFGEEYIAKHIQLLRQAVNDIEEIANTVEMDFEFERVDTLYSASCLDDVEPLKKEYEFLKKHHCELDFITRQEIEEKYPFSREAAIYSYNDGQMNPFKFTHALMKHAHKKGVQIFEHTEMNGHYFNKDENKMIITTKNGFDIKATHVIFAAGYEGLEIKKEKQASFVSTFTVTTKPIEDLSVWYKRTLLWETARPYIYVRTTKDNRIIIGGLDDSTEYPEDRDSKIVAKKNQLLNELNTLFPSIKTEADFYLGAFYGGITDGIPIIGQYEDFPNCFFLFAFGDNGTVYSQVLSKLIAKQLLNQPNPDLALYLQNRPLLSN